MKINKFFNNFKYYGTLLESKAQTKINTPKLNQGECRVG